MNGVRAMGGRSFGRAVEYLGVLGKTLRDLSGFATLAHELIQNAEDAGASWLGFDIREQGLVVDNNGVFSDCGQIENAECPWKEDPARQHRCDFHRFCIVAGGDKRGEAGTVGAFGIGFTAVYQVTDRPSLISAGRHWVIDETLAEQERIFECGGCAECQAEGLPGTRVFLPWAVDGQSELRTKLRAEPVSTDVADTLEEDLKAALPTAMLFLKNLRKVEVTRIGRKVLLLEREEVGDRIMLFGGLGDRIWHLVRGEFITESDALKLKHLDRIEEKRRAEVLIAVPEDLAVVGLLCAFLPTQHTTGFPFHIQADFFPTSDRKRIVLDAGYQADWNKAAITAAAYALADAIEQLKETLGANRLWGLAAVVNRVALEAKKQEREPIFGTFWQALQPALRDGATVRTTSESWVVPRDALLLERSEEEVSEPILTRLGLPLTHIALRPFFGLLRSGDIGVPLLDVPRLLEAIYATGVSAPVEPSLIRAPVCEADFLTFVWAELGHLLQRPRKEDDRIRITTAIERCPIVPCQDGKWRPGDDTYRADERSIDVCKAIGLSLPFAALVPEMNDIISRYCVPFGVELAVNELEEALKVNPHLEIPPSAAHDLIGWFEDERPKWLSSPGVKARIAALPIFPTARGLHSLDDLSLPGDFVDPIGLSDVVDLADLGGRRDFLRELGGRELTVREYARHHVPRAFKLGRLTVEVRRQAVRLVADRLGEIRGDDETLPALQDAALVECTDGLWRKAGEVYSNTDLVQVVLGASVPVALVPDDHGAAIDALLEWLGVAAAPRVSDVLLRLEALPAPTTEGVRLGLASIVQYLAAAWRGGFVDEVAIQRLRAAAWLPAKQDSDHWHRPSEVFATFQEYLFATSATFLDLPLAIQQGAADFLKQIGVGVSPSVVQVVNHLLNCTTTGQVVNEQVFGFLSDEVTDANDHLVQRLRDRPFIPSPAGGYFTASQVFWGGHPFGHWRATLASEFRRYQPLFERVGVREKPEARDAMGVLDTLVNEYGQINRVLDPEACAVAIDCWRMLSSASDTAEIAGESLVRFGPKRVVPGPREILEAPDILFFEDKTGLAQKFPRLRSSTIPRIEGAWRAMALAGVRSLAQSARIQLLECDGAQEDKELKDRVLTRRSEIKRVLTGGAPTQEVNGAEIDVRLQSMHYFRAERLLTRYEVKAFGRVEVSEEEHVTALYHPDENTLFRLDGQSDRIWVAVARELARAFDPDGERVGALAAGIRDVLAAHSSDEAAGFLDELGYPPTPKAVVAAELGLEINSLGSSEETVSLQGDLVLSEVEGINRLDQTKAVMGFDSLPTSAPSTGHDEPGLVAPFGKPVVSSEASEGETSTLSGAPRTPRNAVHRPQSRLVSYVSMGSENGDACTEEPAVTAARTALDRAGIERVMNYERSCGRFPTEMPHNNPGFDIESRDSTGQIVRYIEVKSTGSEWGDRGVALSDIQYECARERADLYWLYVVPLPHDQDCTVFRIKGPAQRVRLYVFDSGWQVAAEA